MKLLILGGRGMAGHMIHHYLLRQTKHDVFVTTRDPHDSRGLYLDVTDSVKVEQVLELVRPDVVINAIGILNEDASRNEEQAFEINGLLPHRLRHLVEKQNGRLIHISTDCVFSGERGEYCEDDLPDGTSVYARSKAIGDVRSERHLTIRTSIIGPEIRDNGIGLLQWFLRQEGVVKGYTRVLWNGVTTLQLAKSITQMIEQDVKGLYHLAAPEKVSKYELLLLFQSAFDKRNITIVPDDEIRLDRTLKNTRIDFLHTVPSMREMLLELRDWMSNS